MGSAAGWELLFFLEIWQGTLANVVFVDEHRELTNLLSTIMKTYITTVTNHIDYFINFSYSCRKNMEEIIYFCPCLRPPNSELKLRPLCPRTVPGPPHHGLLLSPSLSPSVAGPPLRRHAASLHPPLISSLRGGSDTSSGDGATNLPPSPPLLPSFLRT